MQVFRRLNIRATLTLLLGPLGLMLLFGSAAGLLDAAQQYGGASRIAGLAEVRA